MGKKYDLAIKTGEYEKNGEKKGRYKNIGAVMEGQNGPYILLDSTCISMQLFALVNKDRRDSVIVSMFEPKGSEQSGQSKQAEQPASNLDDDSIPF